MSRTFWNIIGDVLKLLFILFVEVSTLSGLADVGCDPKFFFGDSNAEGMTYLPDENDLLTAGLVEHMVHYPPATAYCPGTPSPKVANNTLRGSSEIAVYKIIPSRAGLWGIIPSRAVMITNLPKTTQLWTLIELLNVCIHDMSLIYRVSATEVGFLQK